MPQLKDKIIKYCEDLGLDTVGFIPVRTYLELSDFYKERQSKGLQNEFETEETEERVDPRKYLEKGKTIISIAFPYIDEPIDEHINNGFSIYTQRGDYHKVVKGYLSSVCEYIEQLGGQAVGLVDSHGLPERYIAYLAGVGFIGKNNMLITKKYGSYVFLGEIITDLEIECTEQRQFEEITRYIECGACEKCREACPPKAINKIENNANRCLSYLTQKKHLSSLETKRVAGKLFGCDICQSICPYNQQVQLTTLEAFKTMEMMTQEGSVYAEMDNKFFKNTISQTSCGWRGKNVIRRNAIIAQHANGESIEKYKGDSPYINECIERLQSESSREQTHI